ncbi:GMC oxidoreductase [Plectosphaerella plurivora]|uniref:GMC oxidoreductase n=1 Tax=Plectosphaerella plurivora TaxID=936078 RepID=A0A9P8VI96_9PEZI|nr:GMC oxidoreductase [Plectosphaerella plurivora]
MSLWDIIVVGGGIAGSVVSSRLHGLDPTLKILLIEGGPNTHLVEGIEWTNMDAAIGGPYDWGFSSVPQAQLDNRSIISPVGKGLGGGSIINGAAWVRGDQADYNIWGERVNDERWSYNGLLPYMRRSETFYDNTTNSEAHGHGGPIKIQSVTSTNRVFPLREPLLESWKEIGISALPGFDGNSGQPQGVAELQENRDQGRRQLASLAYSLDGIEVLTDAPVASILTRKTTSGKVKAYGVRLANGTEFHGHETILSAGAYRTPQILMLSGIGPSDTLQQHNIPVVVDQPAVGKNFHDHVLIPTVWALTDPEAEGGLTKESGNPVFDQPQYSLGAFIDFYTMTALPKKGLEAAITENEAAAPGPDHPLLQNRTHSAHLLQYSGVAANAVMMTSVVLINEARGSVTIQSGDINDSPLIDPNFLGTAVDRYAARETIRRNINLLVSKTTMLGREYIAGELAADPLTPASSDAEIDARIRQASMGCFHPAGTASMGTVVDTELRVNGVKGLRVVDSSVIPVSISANLQVAVYALAEQAAEIIHATRLEC